MINYMCLNNIKILDVLAQYLVETCKYCMQTRGDFENCFFAPQIIKCFTVKLN